MFSLHSLRGLIRRHLLGAWRHRWPAVLFTWLICAVGWAFTFSIPNQYEASARLYVDADAVLTPLLRGLAVENQTLNQVEMLQRTLLSRPNLEKLISKTDLELSVRSSSDMQKMVDELGTDIRVGLQTRNLFTISYRNSNPKLAYDVVQAVLTSFVENKTGANRADMQNAQAFLTQQINSYERQLRDAERKRADFRAKYVDLLPQGDGSASKLDAAQSTVRGIQGQLQDAMARRDMLTRELNATQPLLVTESDGPGGVNRLAEAQRALQELRLRYTEQHPDVVAQRNLVAAMRSGSVSAADAEASAQRTAGRNRSTPNPVYEQLKVRLVENDAVISSLQRQLADATQDRDRLQEVARTTPGLQAEFLNLDRDYDVLRRNYEELLARRESMRIGQAAEADADKMKLQIIDPPQVPQNPVAPKRILFLSGVLVAALGGGMGLALLLAQFDQSFHSTDELRDLGFPVVGGVSFTGAGVPFFRRALSAAVFALAVLVPAVVYGGLVYRALNPATKLLA